jgi:hypothetical protein
MTSNGWLQIFDGVKRIPETLKFRGTRCQGSQVRIRLSAEGNPVRTLGSTDRSSGSTFASLRSPVRRVSLDEVEIVI